MHYFCTTLDPLAKQTVRGARLTIAQGLHGLLRCAGLVVRLPRQLVELQQALQRGCKAVCCLQGMSGLSVMHGG